MKKILSFLVLLVSGALFGGHTIRGYRAYPSTKTIAVKIKRCDSGNETTIVVNCAPTSENSGINYDFFKHYTYYDDMNTRNCVPSVKFRSLVKDILNDPRYQGFGATDSLIADRIQYLAWDEYINYRGKMAIKESQGK